MTLPYWAEWRTMWYMRCMRRRTREMGNLTRLICVSIVIYYYIVIVWCELHRWLTCYYYTGVQHTSSWLACYYIVIPLYFIMQTNINASTSIASLVCDFANDYACHISRLLGYLWTLLGYLWTVCLHLSHLHLYINNWANCRYSLRSNI